jgi:TolB-like protein/tetratricopeptide (TPR) repeat protein
VIGRTISHFAVERRLGAGGMATVFLARDLALGRPAALKVVTGDVDPSLRTRLLKEAEAGARLQHPAIATFYESGEADDVAFIAMEYVEGETVRERLARGTIPIDAVIAAGAVLLEALHHAHLAGLLHRDIKPENVMLTAGGAPKLLDFGLARATSLDGVTDSNLTMGGIAGTVGYMSPEQLGGHPLDARSDLFAVGALLYEMIAGRPAFPGVTIAERITAILNRDPDPLPSHAVPPALSAILRRALARNRDSRFPSAAAFLSEWRGLSDGSMVESALPQTLAVLDLRNVSGRSDDEWIGSGVAESLAADLTRVPGLTVVAREKVLGALRAAASGQSTADALQVAGTLGCRWVLAGGFQRLGPAIRITTALSDVATGQVLSAEKLDGATEEIFEMQDRLSRAVISSLNLQLPTPAPAASGPPDVLAFEYYARGRRLWQRLEKGTFDQARELYERAIALHPNYAPALSGLAALHAMRFTFTTDPGELEQASAYAQRAIASNPRLGDPHIWLGYALMRQGRMDEALQAELTAAALEPDSVYALYFAGCVEQFRHRSAAALPYFQRAVGMESHGFAWLGLGWVHCALGNLAEALWCGERAVALEQPPAFAPTVGAGSLPAECLRLLGRLEESRATCTAAVEAVERSDHMYRDTFRVVALCCLGRIALQQADRPAARAAFTQAVSHLTGRPRTLGGGFLMVQALAGLAITDSPGHLDEADGLFERRDRYNFAMAWGAAPEFALVDLARAAMALGRPGVTERLEQARATGNLEARLVLEGTLSWDAYRRPPPEP